MKKKKKHKTVQSPKIPTSYSSYILFNPKFTVDTVLTVLRAGKVPLTCMIKGKESDFPDPTILFKVVNKPISFAPQKGEPHE